MHNNKRNAGPLIRAMTDGADLATMSIIHLNLIYFKAWQLFQSSCHFLLPTHTDAFDLIEEMYISGTKKDARSISLKQGNRELKGKCS